MKKNISTYHITKSLRRAGEVTALQSTGTSRSAFLRKGILAGTSYIRTGQWVRANSLSSDTLPGKINWIFGC